MFTMEERTDLIHFEYDGVQYAMTEAEIEAAYRYKERQCRQNDALRQLDYFTFGYEAGVIDLGDATPSEVEDIDDFEDKYGVTYFEAKKFADDFAACFLARYDCNVDENEQWAAAIKTCLENLKQ